MSRYFKYNYLNPNNFGTRRQFFRHRGCATDHSKHYHLDNLDNWPDPSEKGNWVLEKSCFIAAPIIIEEGQTLCIADAVRLTLYGHGSQGPGNARIIVKGRLNIWGELLCVPSAVGTDLLNVNEGGHIQIEKTGILENFRSTQNFMYGTINSSGTFINKGLITNKGRIIIAGQHVLDNEGYINCTNGGCIEGVVTGSGTTTGCDCPPPGGN